MGECLHAIDKMGGKVVSVTTDGFITSEQDLESRLTGFLIQSYQRIRLELSGNSGSLELKSSGRGVMV